MHPVIRIICFLVFVTSLSRANAGQLFWAMGLLLFLYLYRPHHDLRKVGKMLSRLRWLFLSIIVLYLWFSPEGRVSNEIIGSPLIHGLLAGSNRVVSLVLVVFAVAHLLANLSQAQLLGAIYWLSAPVNFLGVQRNRLALRIVLTMEAVTSLQALKTKAPIDAADKRTARFKQWWETISNYYHEVLQRAEETPCHAVSFESLNTPPVYEWFYPLMLLGTFIAAGRLENLM